MRVRCVKCSRWVTTRHKCGGGVRVSFVLPYTGVYVRFLRTIWCEHIRHFYPKATRVRVERVR